MSEGDQQQQQQAAAATISPVFQSEMLSSTENTNGQPSDMKPAIPAASSPAQQPIQSVSDNVGGPGLSMVADRTDICRDFMKNICNRGSRCKYYHPPDAPGAQKKEEFKFCIDYQNRGCQRENCRYVHAHREDAEHYKATGEITDSLARAIAAVSNKDNVNGIPFCKEFQMGKCSRGQNRCRYWHINPQEERERRSSERQWGGAREPYAPQRPREPYRPMAPPEAWGYPAVPRPYDGYQASFEDAYGRKRPRYDDDAAAGGGDYVAELQRKNGELIQRNEELEIELRKSRERYEDLYNNYLLAARQQNVAAASSVSYTPAAAAPALAPVLAVTAPAPQQVQVAAAPAPNVMPVQAASMVPASMSLVSNYGQTMAQQPQMSVAAMAGQSDVAVHWSTMHR